MNTLFLNNQYDLSVDSSGNIALATMPYALAQDAASAVATFSGECLYDTSLGLPYLTDILGHFPPIQLIRSQAIAAAMTVPEVASAKVFFSGFDNRVLSGQVQVTSTSGLTSVAAL